MFDSRNLCVKAEPMTENEDEITTEEIKVSQILTDYIILIHNSVIGDMILLFFV